MQILARFPADYGAELQGIANATGINIAYIIIYNIFYEVSSLCTSIVAQDPLVCLLEGKNEFF